MITKSEVKTLAIAAPLTGFVAGSGSSTIAPTDTILQAIQKLMGNDGQATVFITSIQSGNNLFNYYNFF